MNSSPAAQGTSARRAQVITHMSGEVALMARFTASLGSGMSVYGALKMNANSRVVLLSVLVMPGQ